MATVHLVEQDGKFATARETKLQVSVMIWSNINQKRPHALAALV